MTIQECYECIGADYNDVLKRLQMERLVIKYVLKFLNDTNFETLEKALKQKDYEDAYRAAHTLKGISANLGFSCVYEYSTQLSELLKQNKTEELEDSFTQLKKAYLGVVSVVKQFKDANQ